LRSCSRPVAARVCSLTLITYSTFTCDLHYVVITLPHSYSDAIATHRRLYSATYHRYTPSPRLFPACLPLLPFHLCHSHQHARYGCPSIAVSCSFSLHSPRYHHLCSLSIHWHDGRQSLTRNVNNVGLTQRDNDALLFFSVTVDNGCDHNDALVLLTTRRRRGGVNGMLVFSTLCYDINIV